MNDKIKAKNFILIIIFAIIFSNSVTNGIRAVLLKFLEVPTDYIGFAQWGDTFFLRILASIVGTATGAFVIGTFLKNKAKLAAIIATLPTVIFWLVVLMLNITKGNSSENIKAMLLLPGILAILSPVVGFFSAGWGQKHFNDFQRPRSILNIKWFSWLWILLFYLTQVTAVLLFTLLLLWRIDANSAFTDSPILLLISNFGNTISRIIVFVILAGLIASVRHVYSLLSEEKTTAKINWKNGIIIFGHVLLFSILFFLLFVLPSIK